MPDNIDIKDLLTQYDYQFKDCGDYICTQAKWRNGDDVTSVAIYKNDNNLIAKDFVTGDIYNLKQLINLVTGDENYVEGHNIILNKPSYHGKLKMPEYFDESVLNGLIKDYTYFNKRNISNEVLSLFKCGICLDAQNILGKYKGRFVFPIFNSSSKLIGFSARDITGKSKIRWKTGGQKQDFCFPLIINRKIIQEEKSIYLFEGIPDILSAFEVGIRNCACTFGTEMGLGLLNVLIKLNPKKIYICLNSDGPGQEAAEKLKRRLYKYFNTYQIEIKYPPTCEGCKDLNDVLMQENGRKIILEWYKS